MAKTIKYTGSERGWDELAYTGKQSVWFPGQQEERSDTEANQLLASGVFTRVYAENDSFEETQALHTADLLSRIF